MVEPLAVFTLITSSILVIGSFLGYYIFENFTGIIIGIAGSTAFNYLFRNLILGMAKAAVNT